MNTTNRASFLEAFKNEFSAQIEDITEVREDAYVVYLKEGVRHDDFVNQIIPFTNSNSNFDDSFDLVVTEFEADYKDTGIVFSVNGDYSDSDDDLGMAPESELEPLETFQVDVEGEVLTIIPQEGPNYLVQNGDNSLGAIRTEWIDDNLVWVSDDLIAPDLVEKIGEAIEAQDM
jgi:hypothetical protein